MNFHDPARSARALIARADKVIVIGEAPKDGEELWVTVIVGGQAKQDRGDHLVYRSEWDAFNAWQRSDFRLLLQRAEAAEE